MGCCSRSVFHGSSTVSVRSVSPIVAPARRPIATRSVSIVPIRIQRDSMASSPTWDLGRRSMHILACSLIRSILRCLPSPTPWIAVCRWPRRCSIRLSIRTLSTSSPDTMSLLMMLWQETVITMSPTARSPSEPTPLLFLSTSSREHRPRRVSPASRRGRITTRKW